MDSLSMPILRDINLTIKKNEFISIVGPSGSGKSTLMHLIGLLDTPTSGRIFLDNENISQLSEERMAKLRNQKIGFVFQTFNLIPRTSALANVELPLIYAGVPDEQRKERALKMLQAMGLGERVNHFPNQLSGGEQQRVAIARALINNPSLILADEPTGNLDSKTGAQIMEILKKLKKDGNTVVLVTHDLEVAKIADRIIKIYDGKII
ncbi:MAG: ABC transporter ATP-binding protein [Candidatus Shapirobacteria bacterium]|nr:ABC transporter ATP-binding protein [Candidatus Shapirobacteria bacterium]